MLLYRVVLTLVAPALAVALLLRLVRRRETWRDLAERAGRTRPAPLPGGPRLWLHGASNGELTAARPLLDALRQRHPALTCIVTANTVTGSDLVRDWALAGVDVQLAPLDYRLCNRAFWRRHAPSGLIVIENELWPNRLMMARERECPVVLVAARLSERSARRWAYLGGLTRRLLSGIALIAPQDTASGARLAALGAPKRRIAAPVALKAAVTLDTPCPADVAALGFDRAETLLAASTHAGEEETILRAFVAARAERPALRLILAPRHPVRSPEVQALVAAAGLTCAVRSTGAPPGNDAVYLADTLGEMPLWYAASGLCFVGGSLVPKGGHTPFEPAQFGCAILTGPHVENAAEAYGRLDAAQAVRHVADASALTGALVGLDAAAQSELGRRAQAAFGPADLAPLLDEIEAALRLRRTAEPAIALAPAPRAP